MRLLIDPPLDGATNMARDEALLASHARGTAPATLRLYGWSPACLSLGRFQRSGEIDRGACERAGVAVVRRPSGGRALLHDCELTYTLVIGTDTPLGQGTICQSYQRISAGLLAGLLHLGAQATLAPSGRERQPANAACYATSAAYELLVDGQKLVGSAQTRRENALLQHGSLPIASNGEQLSALLHHPPTHLDKRIATLDAALGYTPTFDDIAEALVAGCSEAWGVQFVRGAWQASELALADELRTTTYANETWTYAR